MSEAPQFTKLFEPGRIGKMTVKNRIVNPPMEKGYCNRDGTVTQRYLDFVETRAAGGVGLMIVEATAIDPRGRGRNMQFGAWDDNQIPGMRRMADVAHKYDMKVATELYHGGREATPMVTTAQLVSSSSSRPCGMTGGYGPRQLTVPEVKDMVRRFADGARRTREAGFDMVEIHGAHGYLIMQFLSPFINDRVDEYGGSFENRMRFPLEIVAAVRAAVGGDYPVAYRFSCDEYVDGGLTLEDMKIFCKRLEEASVDVLDVSAGIYESVPWIVPPMGFPLGTHVHLAAGIKEVVSVPVIAVGRILHPVLAESILESGQADFVAMGRASHCDPEWPKKAMEGRVDDIRVCIACNECAEIMFAQAHTTCTINAECGHEREMAIRPADRKKKVVVIGAGPAGMEAARVLRLRGHSVTLVEREKEPGGQLRYAAKAPGMQEMEECTRFLWHEMGRLGVETLMGTEATVALVERMNPDAVVVATGAKEIVPPTPGAHAKNVVKALAVLDGSAEVGQKVLVYGGKVVGAKVAELLGSRGHQVIVTEAEKTIGCDLRGVRLIALMQSLQEYPNIELRPDTTVEEILGSTVILQSQGRSEEIAGIDTIVLAWAFDSENTLGDALRAANKPAEVYFVGDCELPRPLLDVIHEASRTARMI